MESTQNRKRTKCEVYSRVVGYLRPVQQWNVGKQEEYKQRKTFKIPEVLNESRKNSKKRGEESEIVQEELEESKG